MNPLRLASMITRVNKTLNFAGQIIPLYMKAKPIINNAKNAMSVAKVFLNNQNNSSKAIEKEPLKNASTNISKTTYQTNRPVFFL